jgi:hypothetical protein
VRRGGGRDTGGEVAVELVTHGFELPQLEFAHPEPAPAFSGADHRGIHELEEGTLAEGVRNDFGPAPFLAKQSLEEICGRSSPVLAG